MYSSVAHIASQSTLFALLRVNHLCNTRASYLRIVATLCVGIKQTREVFVLSREYVSRVGFEAFLGSNSKKIVLNSLFLKVLK